jgi:hypothetical protein
MNSPRQDGAPAEPAGAPAITPNHSHARFIAYGVFERFRQIHAVLAPVIGHRGVVALYERSLHLSSRAYPWLAAPKEGFRGGMDLEGLRQLVAQQDGETAAAGAGLLLKSFHELLAGLVGVTLTSQLLGAPPSLGPSPDTTP